MSSGPSSCEPSRRNHSTSPEDTNVCRPLPDSAPDRRPVPVSPRIDRTSKAVSSADETRTTSRPITSPSVRARNG